MESVAPPLSSSSHTDNDTLRTVPLPPELLAHIFTYYCYDENEGHVVARPYQCLFPMACRRTWPSHSETCPLSVHFLFTPWKDRRRTWQFITTLTKRASQWEDIRLRFLRPLYRGDLNLDGPFPALRHLALQLPSGFSEYPEDWAQYTVADLTDAPLLQVVHLTNWNHNYEVLLPWHQLTKITLDACRLPHLLHGSVDEHDCLAIFHVLCPNLVECTLTDTMWDQDNLSNTAPRLTHRLLRLCSGCTPATGMRTSARRIKTSSPSRAAYITSLSPSTTAYTPRTSPSDWRPRQPP
ncbi:hypothetical protein DFH09DRAFT_649777 [Mycena vulgaris]|nr:hypothetical protein DFH09DRAFT_649777 [Mycena vulgaris]